MKKLALLAFCLLMLCSCGTEDKQNEEKNDVTVITCAEKDKLVKDGAVLIDVRTAQEYSEGHLEGSINLDVNSISVNIEKLVTDKETKIVVYCRSGNRSATAAQTLINLGYKNVYDLGAMSSCSN